MNDRAAVFPDPAVVARLALSDSGFVFDPVSGRSYTVNATGLAVLRALGKAAGIEDVLDAVGTAFEGDRTAIERDVIEFAAQLRSQLK